LCSDSKHKLGAEKRYISVKVTVHDIGHYSHVANGNITATGQF